MRNTVLCSFTQWESTCETFSQHWVAAGRLQQTVHQLLNVIHLWHNASSHPTTASGHFTLYYICICIWDVWPDKFEQCVVGGLSSTWFQWRYVESPVGVFPLSGAFPQWPTLTWCLRSWKRSNQVFCVAHSEMLPQFYSFLQDSLM